MLDKRARRLTPRRSVQQLALSLRARTATSTRAPPRRPTRRPLRSRSAAGSELGAGAGLFYIREPQVGHRGIPR
eukprot:803012-Pyramimonas_sp.AAC.1